MSNDASDLMPGVAAFLAVQLAFISLLKKGILSTAEADEILRKAIDSIKTADGGDQAAELLTEVSERLSKISAATP